MKRSRWAKTKVAVALAGVVVFNLFISAQSGFSQAILLPLDTPVAGTMVPSGTVRYEVVLPTPGILTITLSGWLATLNWGMDFDRLYVYNSAGQPVEIESFGSEADPFLAHMMHEDPTVLTTRVGQAGTYYIDLHSGAVYDWPEGVSQQNYTISVSFTEVEDPHEPNDSLDSATQISIGEELSAYSWRQTPTAAVWGDEDWYRVEVPSPGVMSIILDGWVATLNWAADFDRLYLYGASGQAVGGGGEDPYYSWMMPSPDTIKVNLSYGGTYYVRLHSGAGYSSDPYTLKLDFLPVADPFEPNDTAADAKPLEPGREYQAFQWRSLAQGTDVFGDEDWYYFTALTPGDLTINIQGWASIYNWSADYDRIYLYSGSALAADPNATPLYEGWMIGDNYSYTLHIDSPGKYLLRLHSGAAASTTPYTIRLDYTGGYLTGVEEEEGDTQPAGFALSRNYPNPLNSQTVIVYRLPEACYVTLTVYNPEGQVIKVLVREDKPAGSYRVVWDGSDDAGRKVASGIYLYELRAGSFVKVRRMVLVR